MDCYGVRLPGPAMVMLIEVSPVALCFLLLLHSVIDLSDLFSSEEEDFVSQPKRPRGFGTSLSNIPG